jgi:hypothetical protein
MSAKNLLADVGELIEGNETEILRALASFVRRKIMARRTVDKAAVVRELTAAAGVAKDGFEEAAAILDERFPEDARQARADEKTRPMRLDGPSNGENHE